VALKITEIGTAGNGLPMPRLEGRAARNTVSCSLFATQYSGMVLRRPPATNTAYCPDRQAAAAPDLRMMHDPIGPGLPCLAPSNFSRFLPRWWRHRLRRWQRAVQFRGKGHGAHPVTGEISVDAIVAALAKLAWTAASSPSCKRQSRGG